MESDRCACCLISEALRGRFLVDVSTLYGTFKVYQGALGSQGVAYQILIEASCKSNRGYYRNSRHQQARFGEDCGVLLWLDRGWQLEQ